MGGEREKGDGIEREGWGRERYRQGGVRREREQIG